MRFFATLAVILSMAVTAPLAHADSFQTFQLQNVTFGNSPNLATGTIVIDTMTGTFVSTDIAYTLGSTPLFFIGSTVPNGILPDIFSFFLADTTNHYLLNLSVPGSLIGYTGGPICASVSVCTSYGNAVSDIRMFDGFTFSNYIHMETGSLQPISPQPIPEPSSLLLLSTGLIGLGATVKRRVTA